MYIDRSFEIGLRSPGKTAWKSVKSQNKAVEEDERKTRSHGRFTLSFNPSSHPLNSPFLYLRIPGKVRLRYFAMESYKPLVATFRSNPKTWTPSPPFLYNHAHYRWQPRHSSLPVKTSCEASSTLITRYKKPARSTCKNTTAEKLSQ